MRCYKCGAILVLDPTYLHCTNGHTQPRTWEIAKAHSEQEDERRNNEKPLPPKEIRAGKLEQTPDWEKDRTVDILNLLAFAKRNLYRLEGSGLEHKAKERGQSILGLLFDLARRHEFAKDAAKDLDVRNDTLSGTWMKKLGLRWALLKEMVACLKVGEINAK